MIWLNFSRDDRATQRKVSWIKNLRCSWSFFQCDKINSSAAMMMRFLSLSSFAAAGYLSNRREPGNLEQWNIFCVSNVWESLINSRKKKLLIAPAAASGWSSSKMIGQTEVRKFTRRVAEYVDTRGKKKKKCINKNIHTSLRWRTFNAVGIVELLRRIIIILLLCGFTILLALPRSYQFDHEQG